MNPNGVKLVTEVFDCEHCADLGTFRRSKVNHRFYKFPPIIGTSGEAELLFIGINPRFSDSNEKLHGWVMESFKNFAMLARNRLSADESYIASAGKEEHYHCHMMVIEGVFGAGTKFEEVAAVTELMHCASKNEPMILSRQKSPCAELYLMRVIQTVKPQVVIAVGSGVRKHLETHFEDIIQVPVVRMEHPRSLHGNSHAAKLRAMKPTIDGVREIFGNRGCYI